MKSLRFLFGILSITTFGMLISCGGGGGAAPAANATTEVASASSFPVSHLKKYSGTWLSQCGIPVKFADGSNGPAFYRERLEFSEPDTKGQITLALTVEFSNVSLSCYDYTTKPFASVKWAVPLTLVMDRLVTINIYGPTSTDVVKASRGATASTVVGTGFSSVIAGGVDSWRITFADGTVLDQPKYEPPLSGEASLFSYGLNLEPNALLALNGDTARPYRRQ